MVDTRNFGIAYSGVPVETDGETIGIWKLPSGSIDRAYQTAVQLEPGDAITTRIDIGVKPEGVDVETESDLKWFNGVTEKSAQADTAERLNVTTTSTWIRLVVSSSASAGTTATIAATKGRA